MIRVHNTLGRSVVPFETREDGKVSFYLCGPTVQSEPHVGHGRSAAAFDAIRRYLLWRGFDVTFVMNVTDVEDKIIAAAAESGARMEDLAVEMADRFTEAYRGLGALDPDIEPRATETIPEIIDLIEVLLEKGLAYVVDDDVYFSVRASEAYGALSGRKPDDLRSGHRIEVDDRKEDPLDFALWKGMKPGEPSWDSPWGPGRPGWHIECSAMSAKYLGNDFDIHAGGADLIFPHHENEIAQSEGASGERFARYWLHNGMVNLGGEKMAKSSGLVVDLATILKAQGGRGLRLLYLRVHYRSPIEYSDDLLADAHESLDRLDRFRDRAREGKPDDAALERFREAMDDDFNTPEAVSLLFDLVRDGNRLIDDGGDASAIAGAVEAIVEVLGLDDPAGPEGTDLDLGDAGRRFGVSGSTDEIAQALIGMRAEARARGDYDTADSVRNALGEAGVVLEDRPDGTRWLRK